jgi:ferrochelatase
MTGREHLPTRRGGLRRWLGGARRAWTIIGSVSDRYDAVLLVSFGGPEGPDDVLPFLENVTRGRGVPPERLVEVAEHYHHFGGKSPINEQNRALIAALRRELGDAGIALPIYWGNRNWHPFLADTMAAMADAGVTRALAFVTAAYSSYSSCRQYQENIAAAREAVGEGAPEVTKIRPFFNHPGFIDAQADLVSATLATLPEDQRGGAELAFCAHSIPVSMAAACDYEEQLAESARLVVERLAADHAWQVVYQSRSGPPQVPWLGPDIADHLSDAAARGAAAVVMVPIGFVSDHMEVLFDLDTEAVEHAAALGLTVRRAPSVGTHPLFVSMIRELIDEHRQPGATRVSVGRFGPRPEPCSPGCCPAPARPGASPQPA